MFSRRTIQRLLDGLCDTLSQRVLTELTARLNEPGKDRFAAIWEVSLMYALGRVGKMEYQPLLSDGRMCAAAAAGILWKSFRPRSGRPPHCSFHQHLLGPAGYH